MSKQQTIALWVVTGLLSLTFIITGGSKLASVPPSPENFARWGLSTLFMYGIGAVEVLGGLALLWPKTSPFAAIVLSATMLGALRTGIVFHELLHIFVPLLLLALLSLLLYFRRAQLMAFFARRSHPGT